MTLSESNEEQVVFEITGPEHKIIHQVLGLYPLVPPAHQAVTRGIQDATEYQQLLDQALSEQRKANKEHLSSWLARPETFRKAKAGWRLAVLRADAEWLLQVINDVRVGCWLLLGSPEDTLEPGNLNPKQLQTWVAMQVCGYLQMAVLQAVSGL